MLNYFPGQEPKTTRETSFVQAYGRELLEAREACRRYRAYGETSELDKAWDIYYGVCVFLFILFFRLFNNLQVFKKVEKQLPQLTTLDLQYVSPELLKARNLELAVPGTSKYPITIRLELTFSQVHTKVVEPSSGLLALPQN